MEKKNEEELSKTGQSPYRTAYVKILGHKSDLLSLGSLVLWTPIGTRITHSMTNTLTFSWHTLMEKFG